MTFEIDKEKLMIILKTGIIVLSVILILGLSVKYVPKAVETIARDKRELPIYCVDTEKKQISLSFDGAWGNKDTQQILDILERHKIKASFFFTGGWIEKYPEDVKRIVAAGHDIGNHSENHKQMSKLSKEECLKEIKLTHNKVKELTGIDMNLFRPPYGDYSDTLIKAAKESGYYTIQWDVDSLDWKDYGANSIVKEVVENPHLGNGSIILCHNGAKFIVEALEPMIEGLKEKGYEFVLISQLIYKENYEMDHEGRQFQK